MSSLDGMYVKIQLEALAREFSISPYENPTWNIDNPITKAEIKASIEDDSYKLGNEPTTPQLERISHIRRVAYFVVNGWNDPIEIDFGVPSLGYSSLHPVLDGNHRLAAALFRGDTTILAGVSGEIGYIEEFVE